MENFGNIRYWSMNGRSIGIGPKKAMSVDLDTEYDQSLRVSSPQRKISSWFRSKLFIRAWPKIKSL